MRRIGFNISDFQYIYNIFELHMCTHTYGLGDIDSFRTARVNHVCNGERNVTLIFFGIKAMVVLGNLMMISVLLS